MTREDFIRMMDQQHLGWRKVQGELLETLPENASQGSSWGGCLEWSQGQVYGLEVILKEMVSKEQDEIRRICSMQAEAEPGSGKAGGYGEGTTWEKAS